MIEDDKGRRDTNWCQTAIYKELDIIQRDDFGAIIVFWLENVYS